VRGKNLYKIKKGGKNYFTARNAKSQGDKATFSKTKMSVHNRAAKVSEKDWQYHI